MTDALYVIGVFSVVLLIVVVTAIATVCCVVERVTRKHFPVIRDTSPRYTYKEVTHWYKDKENRDH